MASKFGLLGDVDSGLSQVRRDVQHAAGTINTVRRALAEQCFDSTADMALQGRLVALLQEAEDKLDNLLQRP